MNEDLKSYDIFISHSHHDEKLSHQIKKLLETEGYRCWIAPDCIEPGMVWAEAIQEGISSSKVFLLIYSGHSNLSNQVWREITLAVANKSYIISYKCEDVPLSEVMKYFTATTHFIGFPPTEPESRLKELVDKIKEVIPKRQHSNSVAEEDSGSDIEEFDIEEEFNRIIAEGTKEDSSKDKKESQAPETTHDVFISYAVQDSELANAIRERLRSKGMVCVEEIDRDSEDFGAATISAIEKSKVTLFLYTENTNSSKTQLKELVLSSNRSKIIFPIKMVAENPSSGLEYYLCDNHWLDIHTEPAETQLDSITDSLIMFMYGDVWKNDGKYDMLQNAAGEILIIIYFKASVVDNPRLLFDGSDTAILYRSKDSAISFNGLNEKASEALMNVDHVLMVEISVKTNDVVLEYEVPVKKIKQLGSVTQDDSPIDEHECDDMDEKNMKFDILKNAEGDILIIIGLKKGKPENPRFVIDKYGKALLYRNRESALQFNNLEKAAVDEIRKANEVRLVEVKDDDIAREYTVPVRAIESLDALN